MAKNVIFRRIRGRLIPIKIKSRDISDKSPWVKTRKYEAKKNGDTVGSISIGYGRKSKSPSVDLISANVNEKFQGKGISSAIFGRIMKSLSKTKKKFLRGGEIQHEAQIKIRSKYKTKFLAKGGFGPHGEQSKIVSAKEAIEYLKKSKDPSNKFFTQIQASTRIPKDK